MPKAFNLMTFLYVITLVLSLFSGSVIHAEESETSLKFTGTIVYVPIEGGFYGIEADTPENEVVKKYLPNNLSEDFQQEGLRVKVQAQLTTGQMSFRMWGKMIDIISIVPTDCEANDKKTKPNEQ